MPTAKERDYARLATLAKRRRAELKLALNDTNAKAGGLSNRTWQRVERGERLYDANYTKIDGLLQWAVGSCLAVLDGGDPIPVTDMDDPTAPGVQKSPMPRDAIDQEVRNIVGLALIATTTGTSAEEIREISERVVRDLREHGLT
ncbi:hypothetical protein AB0N99_30425 [Streptomyces sp. NPDC093272]|uniref:hypothetical protein n=1 Tax=unclassified Streptomyces TaxID=2593676 RepID=UPI003424E47E